MTSPQRGHARDVWELRDSSQLTSSGETRTVQLLQEVGVRVDVHHRQAAMRCNPGDQREADRVVPANGDEHAALR